MMTDVENTCIEIDSFLNAEKEKTLLLCGVADKEKHLSLLKMLNKQGNLRGLIYLVHTTKDGIANFFHWAELYNVNIPKKYGQEMRLSNLTIQFDNMGSNLNSHKYDNSVFDFMIIWPMQSLAENDKEVQLLKEMSDRQKTKKIIYLTIKEPWVSPDLLRPIVDRVIKLDCEHDDPTEYQRIMNAYEEDKLTRNY